MGLCLISISLDADKTVENLEDGEGIVKELELDDFGIIGVITLFKVIFDAKFGKNGSKNIMIEDLETGVIQPNNDEMISGLSPGCSAIDRPVTPLIYNFPTEYKSDTFSNYVLVTIRDGDVDKRYVMANHSRSVVVGMMKLLDLLELAIGLRVEDRRGTIIYRR